MQGQALINYCQTTVSTPTTTTMTRSYPNIVITGTPGTGKSTLSGMLLDPDFYPSSSSSSTSSTSAQPQQNYAAHLTHINVSQWARERKDLQLGYDEEWDAYDLDEEKLLDELEPLSGGRAPEPLDDESAAAAPAPAEDEEKEGQGKGGLILDWHTNEVWPERWVDLVVVLRTDHTTLWTRLEKRGYTTAKISENNQAEIMQTVLEEARASYPPEAIVELSSNTAEELEGNAERIVQWIRSWRVQRGLEEA